MSYFSEQCQNISIPFWGGETKGDLQKIQIGAIQGINSHFMTSNNPGIVLLPLFVDLIPILCLTPFVLNAKRMLLLTENIFSANIIKEDFSNLNSLIKLDIIHYQDPMEENISPNIPFPKVLEISKKIENEKEWKSFENYAAVICPPEHISLKKEEYNIISSLFDLIVVIGGNQNFKKIWEKLAENFETQRKILFAPNFLSLEKFQENVIFSYSIDNAYRDEQLPEIKLIPVENPIYQTPDESIVKRVKEIHQKERAIEQGGKHSFFSIVKSKIKGKKLLELYKKKKFPLHFELIHEDLSPQNCRKSINNLKKGEIDGILCTHKLAESFTFPTLEAPNEIIIVVHSNEFLELSVQMLISPGFRKDVIEKKIKLLRIPLEDEEKIKGITQKESTLESSIIVDGKILFPQNNSSKITEYFNSIQTLVSATVYEVQGEVDLNVKPNISKNFNDLILVDRFYSQELSALVFITKENKKPNWIKSHSIFRDITYDVFIVYFDQKAKLLFFNSSRKSDSYNEKILKQFVVSGSFLKLHLASIKRILRGIKELFLSLIFN